MKNTKKFIHLFGTLKVSLEFKHDEMEAVVNIKCKKFSFDNGVNVYKINWKGYVHLNNDLNHSIRFNYLITDTNEEMVKLPKDAIHDSLTYFCNNELLLDEWYREQYQITKKIFQEKQLKNATMTMEDMETTLGIHLRDVRQTHPSFAELVEKYIESVQNVLEKE